MKIVRAMHWTYSKIEHVNNNNNNKSIKKKESFIFDFN